MGLLETMPYEVLEKHKNIELRIYPEFTLAETKTDINEKMDSGFMNVFNYISGQNETRTKISMTTPVVTQKDSNTLITGFYVSSKYKKNCIPLPNSKTVQISNYEQSLFMVIRFRGSWKPKHFEQADRLLRAFILNNHYQIESNQFIFRYQPPFIPSFLKRNEIGYIVKKLIV